MSTTTYDPDTATDYERISPDLREAAIDLLHTYFDRDEVDIDHDAAIDRADGGVWVQAWIRLVPAPQEDES